MKLTLHFIVGLPTADVGLVSGPGETGCVPQGLDGDEDDCQQVQNPVMSPPG